MSLQKNGVRKNVEGETLGKSRHDRIVDKISKRRGGRDIHKGVDLRPKDYAIEVAVSDSDLYQSMGQLNRSRKKKKYLAVPSEFHAKAKRLTKNTGIGVMDGNGNIIKRARGK